VTKHRVAVFNNIAARGLERFPHARYIVGKGLANPDAILLRSHVLQAGDVPPSVKAIARAGAGVNNIPVEAMSQRGVPVFNAPGANANAVKELVLGAMLAHARNVVPAIAYVEGLDSGKELQERLEEGKKQFAGFELAGRTLGVIGLGRLGRRVARVARAFEMDVLAWSQNLDPEEARRHGAEPVGRDALLSRADVVTIHLRLSARTRGLIGAAELARMKPTAVLVNTSRAPIVDEAALVAALHDGTIAGAGLDVFEPEPLPAGDPLRSAPNTVLTPHLGYVTEENYAVYYRDALEDVLAWAAGAPVRVLEPGGPARPC